MQLMEAALPVAPGSTWPCTATLAENCELWSAGQCLRAMSDTAPPLSHCHQTTQGTAGDLCHHSITLPDIHVAYCSTAQRSTAQRSTAQHSAAQHSTAQHSAAQRSAAQHSTAQHRQLSKVNYQRCPSV